MTFLEWGREPLAHDERVVPALNPIHTTHPSRPFLAAVKVTLSNLEEEREVEVLDVPFAPEVGSHKVRLTKTLYIDASDFRREDSKDYFGLAPGKVYLSLDM